MINRLSCQIATVALFTCVFAPLMQAQSLDQIGVTVLRAVTTNLDGTGIRVAQPEASMSATAPVWAVNPASVGQPVALFTYISGAGTTNVFPNFLSAESGHADSVAGEFYGISGGVATNLAHVDNYDADYFFNDLVDTFSPPEVMESVVNQSFIFCNNDYSHLSISDEQGIDSAYDDYAAQYLTLFVSSAGNGGPTNQSQVYPAATCYNGLGVAAYGGTSCTGPTLDNGRCKPDITAPAGATSFSAPQVAGAAAVLMQAGFRGDGGGDTIAATDLRTIKALLLNGAVKPADWTNNFPSPLDYRYGAGVLNLFNAYEQLAGGKRGYIATTRVTSGGPHPPLSVRGTVGVLNGWDLNTVVSSTTLDGVNHYFFNATQSWGGANFTATATLVWNRQLGATNINDLDLFLYNTANSNLVACSTSRVDNVEHLWLPQLPPGRYDLQVLKNGGTNVVSDAETYALAFEFYSQTLSLGRTGTNTWLTWPVYPAGFSVETTASLSPAIWLVLSNAPAIVTNQQNWLPLNPTDAGQFFRLRSP